MLNQIIVNQIKSLEGKTYSLSELEPNFKYNFREILIKANDDSFEVINLVDKKVIGIINYKDIELLNIDSILVSLKLKNGMIYLLKEERDNLIVILKDLQNSILIKKIDDIKIDNDKNNDIKELLLFDYEIIDDKDGNKDMIIIKGKTYDEEENEINAKFIINKKDVVYFDEEYFSRDNRSMAIRLNDGYIIIGNC